MITLRERAFAKVNLTLDVLSKRDDGYHDISTVMQSISLCDEIEIVVDTGAPWCIKCDRDGIPLDERNLVWKAARLFFDAIKEEPNGIEIRIQKTIPSEAGLAGGSADAAAVLRALNRWKGLPFAMEELAELSAAIGSDIPFCVMLDTALAEGRGERLRKLPKSPEIYYVVCKPEVSFSTPKLYGMLDQIQIRNRPDTKAMCQALENGDIPAIGKLLCNVFEEAADDPEIKMIKSELLRLGALGALMSGSGSAVYGVFATQNEALAAFGRLQGRPWQVFCAKTA